MITFRLITQLCLKYPFLFQPETAASPGGNEDPSHPAEHLTTKIQSHLISLLMTFMAYDDQKLVTASRHITKHQTAVLKHLEHLFRYNSIEQRFVVSAHSLRNTASASAFLTGLALVMDINLGMSFFEAYITFSRIQYFL